MDVKGIEVCRDVRLKLLDIEVAQEFFVFQLGNVNVILGVDWLSTFGTTRKWKPCILIGRDNK